MRKIITPLAFTVSLTLSGFVFAAEPVNSIESRLVASTSEAISDFVKSELDTQRSRFSEFAVGKVKSIFRRISDFITSKIGVNVLEGAKLFAEFLFWLFDSLAKLTRWILALF